MQTCDEAKTYCLAKPGAIAEYPFGPGHLVMKVGGKLFAIIGETETPVRINLKNTPEMNLALRDRWESVMPGYHMNKLHWNTVILDGSVPDEEVRRMIDDSYRLVFKSLTKKARAAIEAAG